jgi:ubiquinone/menaquinone biosynthesis C-methylase UbiE
MNAFYNEPSFDYQKYWQEREYENTAERIALKRILKIIGKKEKLLDIGGGYGRLVPEYIKNFKNCLIIDPSEKLLSQAKKLCYKYKNLSLQKGIIEKIPQKNESFDVVLCVRTFHHLENPRQAIKEINRVLKPQGFLILEFANKIRFKNILKAILKLNFKFLVDHKPEKIGKSKIPFYSYHPNQIKTILLSENFDILKTFSVSNFRSPLIKKIIPLKILIKLESLCSLVFSSFPLLKFWGPSIFILAQKK